MKNIVCLKVYNFPNQHSRSVELRWTKLRRTKAPHGQVSRRTLSPPKTHQHVSNHGTRGKPDDQPNEHTGEYGHQRLMDSANPFDLEVIGRQQ